MKKKILSVLLAFALLIILPACGGPADEPPTTESASIPDLSAQTDKTMGRFHTDAILAETVLADEGGVKITATGLTYTAYSADLNLTIENNSGKDLSFASGSLGYNCNSINGYMIDGGYLNRNVANGKKANASIRFNYDALMLCGIDEIADMEIGVSMTDDDYNTTYTGPCQLKTSVAETHDYGTDHYQNTITSGAAMNTYGYEMVHFSQDTLYDKNGVKLLSSGVMTNHERETALLLELENTTGSVVYLSTSDIAINGLLVNSSTWSSNAINPGKRCIVDVDLSDVLASPYWNVYGITQVGAVSLSLEQCNADGMEIAAETPVEIVVPDVNVSFDETGTEVYNSNGMKIMFKDIVKDPSDYSSDLHVLLLAENNSGETLTIHDVYNSLSVNGFMTDYSYYGQELEDGQSAVIEIKLWESSLADNQISSASDIREIEFGLEIVEGYTAIDEPTLTLILGESA